MSKVKKIKTHFKKCRKGVKIYVNEIIILIRFFLYIYIFWKKSYVTMYLMGLFGLNFRNNLLENRFWMLSQVFTHRKWSFCITVITLVRGFLVTFRRWHNFSFKYTLPMVHHKIGITIKQNKVAPLYFLLKKWGKILNLHKNIIITGLPIINILFTVWWPYWQFSHFHAGGACFGYFFKYKNTNSSLLTQNIKTIEHIIILYTFKKTLYATYCFGFNRLIVGRGVSLSSFF